MGEVPLYARWEEGGGARPNVSERRENNLKVFEDFYLNAKARNGA